MRIKAPWLRRCAAAGRAKALTRTPLENLTTELLRRQKNESKAAQKGRKWFQSSAGGKPPERRRRLVMGFGEQRNRKCT
jgi:hypothetical protein